MIWMVALAAEAYGCGGFFCNNVDPVVQSAERILFREDDNGQWTTFVEIQYQGPPSAFAWVLPIARAIDPETEVSTAPAGLFDELEAATAPVFLRDTLSAASPALAGQSCGFGPVGMNASVDTGWLLDPEQSGVEVVGEAVVGPYAIEVITAENADTLAMWLQLNGYQIPMAAAPAFDAYIERDYAFLGLKLQADLPEGPIDTLVLDCAGAGPEIPLLLTQIAAAPSMDLVAYVLASGRYAPENYLDLAVPWDQVRFTEGNDTDYPIRLPTWVREAGGQAWATEFAQPVTGEFIATLSYETATTLGSGAYLSRFHSVMRPEDMTLDPSWAPSEAADVSRFHSLGSEPAQARLPFLILGLVLPLTGVALRRSS